MTEAQDNEEKAETVAEETKIELQEIRQINLWAKNVLPIKKALGYQKGFLEGRSMLKNVLDIDFAAHRVSVKSRTGAILLFDFRAAFPSISHSYLMKVLTYLGLLESIISYVMRRELSQGKQRLLESPNENQHVEGNWTMSFVVPSQAVVMLTRKRV